MLRFLLPTVAVIAPLIASPSAEAAPFDGQWSVLLVTESGACEVYRVNVRVSNGRVLAGADGPEVRGSITTRGDVRLNAVYGRDTATAAGRVSGNFGLGAWNAPSRGCSGRWEAEKRG
jgi:hypothetical protein